MFLILVYCDIPDNLQQYLYHKQETISQSRWCTTASGYLRIYIFDVFELDSTQTETLLVILGFILNVYVPVFVQTNLHPRIPDGPDIILLTRDLMKLHGVPSKVKEILLNHAESWMGPINVAVATHQQPPAVLKEDLLKIHVLGVNTRKLCWSNKPNKSFLTIASACEPCVSVGTSEYWHALDNHTRVAELYIGKMSLVLKKGWVHDSDNKDIDNNIRGYVLNMEDAD